MIFHDTTHNLNLVEVYLNLEELVYLSKLTNTSCKLKINNTIRDTFDLSEFEIIEEIPTSIKLDISDYICVWDTQSEHDPHIPICKLDKFLYQDINVEFSKPNFYRLKYPVNEEAVEAANKFHLSHKFIQKYDFIKSLIAPLPLLCLSKSTQSEFNFKDCFFIGSDCVEGLNGRDLKQYLFDYHKTFQELDLDLLIILLADCFTEIYGFPSDCVFEILIKNRTSGVHYLS